MRKISTRRATTLAGLLLSSCALLPQYAFGQTAGDDRIETVVVTGSHIARTGFDTPMPMTVVDSKEIERTGKIELYEVLRRNPAIGIGAGLSNVQFSAFDAGVGFIDLRNMGTNRSLTLINGRRRVSGSATASAVDINLIPPGMVDRVEVITGGASAVYGADAVTGVVNIITKKDFDGLEVSAQGGVAQHGAGESMAFTLLGGTAFSNNRGHLDVGVSYSDSGALNSSDRDFADTYLFSAANPANKSAHDGIYDNITYNDVRYIYTSYQPTFYIGGKEYIVENGNARVASYKTPITSGALSYGDGGDGRNLIDNEQLRAPVQTLSVRANLRYDFSKNFNFFLEPEFSHTHTDAWMNYYRNDTRSSFLLGAGGSKVKIDNPYLPASVAALMTANNVTVLNISKSYKELGVMTNINDRNLINLDGGFEGSLPWGWKWSVFAQYGRLVNDIEDGNVPLAQNFIYAMDAVTDSATGKVVCRDATARAAGCVPFNIFSGDELTDAQRAYMIHTRLQKTVNTQLVFGGQINGELTKLPAGALSFALGVERRTETLETNDDAAGRNGQASHLATWKDPQTPLDEKFSVSEAYAELLIPVLADMDFAQKLDIDAAYRFSDYNTIGSTNAWKVGINWTPVDDIRFRAARSRSVRAPNLYELFGPRTTALVNPVDPCEIGQYDTSPTRAANCAALGIKTPLPTDMSAVTSTTGGNSNLQEEASDSVTLGFVAQPRFVPGLNISIDYWNIKISDAVSTFNYTTIMNLCVDQPTINNPYCGRIKRGTNLQVSSVESTSINTGRLKANGVDFNVQYTLPLYDGTLATNLMGTYLLSKTQQAVPEVASYLIVQDGNYTDPKLRMTLGVQYAKDNWSVGMSNRFISMSSIDRQALREKYDRYNVAMRIYTDIDASYRFDDTYSFTMNVSNLLDLDPPRTYYTFLSREGSYDTLGRYFTFGLRARY